MENNLTNDTKKTECMQEEILKEMKAQTKFLKRVWFGFCYCVLVVSIFAAYLVYEYIRFMILD